MNFTKILTTITELGAAIVRFFAIGLFVVTTIILVLDLMGVLTGLGVIGYIGCYAISVGLFWLWIKMMSIVFDVDSQSNNDTFTRR